VESVIDWRRGTVCLRGRRVPGDARRRVVAAATAFALGCGVATLLRAQPAPPEETLRALQERGAAIARDLDAGAAADAVLVRQGQAILPPDLRVVIEGPDGPRVVYLKENQQGGRPGDLMILGEVPYEPTSGRAGDLLVMMPPRRAPATTVAFARALQAARQAAAAPAGAPPPDAAVVRETDGSFSVYLVPPDSDGMARCGGDRLARVARNGRTLMSVETLHDGTTDLPLSVRPAGQLTLHVHERGDLPTPTDVALILRHPILAPHLVLTPASMFRIDARGEITYLGPNRPAAGGSAAAPERVGGKP
jgi:hypothetical protein